MADIGLPPPPPDVGSNSPSSGGLPPAPPETSFANPPQAPTPSATLPVQHTADTEQVNVYNPSGELVTIPGDQLERAVQDEGYRVASEDEVKAQDLEDEYGTGWQQAVTFGERAASAATFGLSTGVERFYGVPARDIRAREEVNPKSAIAGSIAGLVGTAFIPGLGEAAIANDALKAGKAAEEGVLLAKKAYDAGAGSAEAIIAAQEKLAAAAADIAANPAAKALNPASAASIMSKAGRTVQEGLNIGTGSGVIQGMKAAATRGAVENVLFNAGDQVSRAFADEPPTTVGNAVAELGLSAVIGGAFTAPFGAVAPLWKATSESKLGTKVGELKDSILGHGVKDIAIKVLSHFGDVDSQIVRDYIANSEAVNAAPEIAQLREHAINHLTGLAEAVETGQASVRDAVDSFSQLEKEMATKFKAQGYEASQAKAKAQSSLKSALVDFKNNTHNKALAKAPEIFGHVEQLRDSVIAGSKGAYDALEGKNVSLEPFYNKANEIISNLRKENAPNSLAMADRLQSYVDSVKTGTVEQPKILNLTHYSGQEGLREINPEHAGTGADAGVKGRDLEHKISHYYTEGTQPEDLLKTKGLTNKYNIKVDLNKHPVYDFANDSENIVQQVKNENNGAFNLDRASEKLKSKGYSGFTNSANTENPGTVHMFEPMKAKQDLSSGKIQDVAKTYMADKGLPLQRANKSVVLSPERGKKIAEAFEKMKHQPNSPAVKKAYNALIKETLDQFQYIKEKTGLTYSKIKPDMENPYPTSADFMKDIRDNNHLWYFPTEQGYGPKGEKIEHPLLQLTKELDEEGKPMPANDVFRIVYDYFGHAEQGNAINKYGEEKAWWNHMKMYSPEAQKALTSETRGQNSWVNFGPHGVSNQLNPKNTIYAEQKAGLLPDWATKEVSVPKAEMPSAPSQKGAVNVKAMVQGLDRDSKWSHGASQFDNGISPYYKQLRRALDVELKKIPEYAQAMEPVAEQTKLLQRLDNFDTPEGATRRVGQLSNKVNYINEMSALRDLEHTVGGDFVKDIEPYANPELNSKLKRAIPEMAEAERTAKVVQHLKDPYVMAKLQDEFEKGLQISKESQALGMAKESLAAARAKQAEFKGATAQTLEGKLNAAMKGKLAAEELIKKLPKYRQTNGEEKSVEELLDLVRIKESMIGGSMHGSRNANTWGAIAGGLLGHFFDATVGGGALGFIAGHVIDKRGHEIVKSILDKYIKHGGGLGKAIDIADEDAIRFSLARALDSTQPITGAGIKAAATYAAKVMAGEKKLDKNSKAVFDENKKIEINLDTKKLQKNLEHHSATNPDISQMDKIGGDINHYFPEHKTAMVGAAASAIAYLQTQKFNRTPASPLDAPPVESEDQRAKYERTLGIAEHPTNILAYIKEGMLTPKDVMDLHALYPALYQNMSNKLTHYMMEKINKGEMIPYQTRLNLSMFLAQPLDSTMQPMSIQAAQPLPTMPPMQAQGKPKGSTKDLGKMAKSYQTPNQAREVEKSAGK